MKKELIHFSIALLVALGALGAYAVSFLSIGAAREGAADASRKVAEIRAEDDAIAQAEGALAALAADEVAVEGYLVSPKDIVAFLEELEGIGEAYGAQVEVASVSSVGNDNRIELAVRIEGSFVSILRSLGVMEYGPRDLRLKQLVLDTRGVNSDASWSAAASFTAAATTP
jgi:hypothetical protein